MAWTLFTGGLTGFLFGFVLQRGRFCMTSGFRDLYLTRDATLFKAYVLSLAIQSTGIFLLQGLGILTLGNDPFQWVAAIAGGLIFGVSLILSGGCASGTYYRIGEGMIGSLVAALFYGIGALSSRAGVLTPVVQQIQSTALEVNGSTRLYGALGVSPWLLVAALWAVAIFFLVQGRRQARPAWQAPVDSSCSPLWRAVFGRGWSWQATGAAVGLVAVLAWVTSISTGRMAGLGITSPTANLLRFVTVSPDPKLLDWGLFMILAIPLGGYVAARAAGEFRWRVPGPARLIQHMIGGLGMGFGATLARGCNVGNGLTAVSAFSLNGWVATAATILGTWLGAYLFLVLPARLASARATGAADLVHGD
jgi:uncharacterized membrane protein YedE/YeeE